MAATKGSTANFEIGNYVLWSRVDQRFSKDKLLAQWVGPFAVTEARPYSFSDPSLTIRRYVRGPWLVTPLLRRLLPEHHGGDPRVRLEPGGAAWSGRVQRLSLQSGSLEMGAAGEVDGATGGRGIVGVVDRVNSSGA
ncbi:hypothetical protein PPTG_17556 [Phytophthora nicotianae INRA-310]|uniref:Uncharacterized protein n=1 Tax=Phytophthora nicotianae (strain INRA-310) TaxID=761204 RepID=W2PM72_PHYN3|nr:hypothetical protein PPTG_17556 [Phytophthora nicotianae INRA-310]ETN01130.1 hypothetical protein PPTG_17556 [Phytophthora nicotianae INRA-310]